jgi:hypothetical protein
LVCEILDSWIVWTATHSFIAHFIYVSPEL